MSRMSSLGNSSRKSGKVQEGGFPVVHHLFAFSLSRKPFASVRSSLLLAGRNDLSFDKQL